MPAREQIVIDASMTENVSQAAGNAGRSVEQLRERIAALNNEIGADKATEYFNAMNQQAQERQQRQGQGQGQSNILQFPTDAMQATGSAARSLAGITSGLGSSGDAGRAFGQAAEGAGGLLRGVGGAVGGALGVGALAVGGVALGVNEVIKTYEGVMEEVMDLTMQLGEYGENAVDQSRKFAETMDEASEAGARFGYRLEETMGVMSSLAKRGASGDVAGLAGYTMQFARGFGMDPGALAGFVGTGARFGQQNSLEGIAGMLNRQNMSPARFGEMMNAQLGIFEDALSRGVVKGFDEIGALQNMFASGGELFRGELGAQRIRQMDNVVAGSTSLGREEDVLMYRAMSGLMEDEEYRDKHNISDDFTYIDTMKQLEQGLTGYLFGAIRSQVENMSGGNQSQMIEMLRSIFNVNYTTAEALLSMSEDEAVNELAEAPDTTNTPEVQLLKVQEQIRNSVKLIASTLVDDKLGITQGFADTVAAIQGSMFDIDDEADSRQADLDRMEADEFYNNHARDLLSQIYGSAVQDTFAYNRLSSSFRQAPDEMTWQSIGALDVVAQRPGFAEYLGRSRSLDDFLQEKTPEEIHAGLSGFIRDQLQAYLQQPDAIGDPYDFISQESRGRNGYSSGVGNALRSVMENRGSSFVSQMAHLTPEQMREVLDAGQEIRDSSGLIFDRRERAAATEAMIAVLERLLKEVQSPVSFTVESQRFGH